MSHRVALLLVSCLTLFPTLPTASAQGPTPKQPPPRTDYFGDPLPEGALARLGSVRFHHQGGVIAAAFAPDAKTILAAGNEKEGLSLRFWETATGKELSRILVKGFDLRGLTFAPDGKTVFLGRQDAVEQYDRHSGKLLGRFATQGYSSFALSADGKELALICYPENPQYAPIVHLREIATGKNRVSLQGQRGTWSNCQWSADGKRILTASYSVNVNSNGVTSKIQGSICLWDVATGKKLNDIPNDHYGAALARDGQTAAYWDQQEGTRVVNVATGKTVCTFKGASDLEFTPDSKALVTVNDYSTNLITFWDARTGKELRQLQGQRLGRIYRGWRQQFGSFSADGRLLAVLRGDWKQDGSVQLWDVATGKQVYNLGSHFDTVTSVAFAPNGKFVASGSVDATVRLWDPTTGKQLGQLDGHKAGVTAVAFSGDGKTLASSSQDGSTRLWDVANRRELARLDGPAGGAASLTFAADGKTLIGGGKTAVIKVWELVGYKETASFRTGLDGSVFALSRDGKLALSANGEVRNDQSTEQLRLWGLPTGRHLLGVKLRGGEKEYHDNIFSWTGALSADARLFAVSHSRASNTLRGTMYADHTVRVWERATGQELHLMADLKGHALAFSPNGRLLAVGHGNTFTFHNHSPDSRVTLWDMATGKSIRVCPGHTNEVACVAFSADGQFLASGSADHTILLWGNIRPDSLPPDKARPTAKQLGLWWDDLKSATSVSRTATIQMLARPELTVPWIRECVKPTPPVDHERIGPLLTALDSPKFKERQKAIEALEALGELAEGRLRQLLAGNPSLEVRRRAELLLAKSEQSQSPEQLRHIRAVAVLEWIGTAQARELLEVLGKGEPESRLTRLAQAARTRMDAMHPKR